MDSVVLLRHDECGKRDTVQSESDALRRCAPYIDVCGDDGSNNGNGSTSSGILAFNTTRVQALFPDITNNMYVAALT